MYEAIGTVHRTFETKQVSDRFSKRELVVETTDNPRYPQFVMFEATGDRIAQLDGLQIGDEVRVEFSVRGREWRSNTGEMKYFTTLDVFRLRKTKSAPAPSDGLPGDGAQQAMPTDDIPF